MMKKLAILVAVLGVVAVGYATRQGGAGCPVRSALGANAATAGCRVEAACATDKTACSTEKQSACDAD